MTWFGGYVLLTEAFFLFWWFPGIFLSLLSIGALLCIQQIPNLSFLLLGEVFKSLTLELTRNGWRSWATNTEFRKSYTPQAFTELDHTRVWMTTGAPRTMAISLALRQHLHFQMQYVGGVVDAALSNEAPKSNHSRVSMTSSKALSF